MIILENNMITTQTLKKNAGLYFFEKHLISANREPDISLSQVTPVPELKKVMPLKKK
jgi:hypothetical protein